MKDVYKEYAAKLFNVEYDKVTPSQRKWAKMEMYISLYSYSKKF